MKIRRTRISARVSKAGWEKNVKSPHKRCVVVVFNSLEVHNYIYH